MGAPEHSKPGQFFWLEFFNLTTLTRGQTLIPHSMIGCLDLKPYNEMPPNVQSKSY